MANKHIKTRCSTSIVIREMQIQTTMRYHFIHIKMPIEESNSWLKTNVWFFRPDHRQLQRLYLTGLLVGWGWGSCSPHTRLGAQPVHHNLWRVLQTRSQSPLASHVLHIFTFLALVPWFLGLFIWGLPPRSPSGTSAKTSLWRKRGENLKSLLSTLTQYPVLVDS